MQERTQYQQELIEIANSLEVADKLYGAGQFAEAAQIYKLAYTSLTRAVGQLDPDTIACLEKLADSYFSAERFGEALPHYKSLLSAGEQILGAAHPDVVAMAAKVSDIADMVDAPPGQAMPALKEGAARLTWSSIAALRPEDIQPTDWTSDWRLQQRIEDNSVFFDFASLNAEKRGTKPIPLPPAVPIHVDQPEWESVSALPLEPSPPDEVLGTGERAILKPNQGRAGRTKKVSKSDAPREEPQRSEDMGRKKRAAAMKFVLIAALVLLLGAGVTIFVRRSQQSVSTPITSQAVADNHMIAANGPAENNADSDKTGATKVKPTEAEATKSFAEKVRKFATADGAKRIDLGTEDNANQARLHYSGSAQSERMPMINIGPSPGDFLSESASCLINKDIWLEEIPEGLRDEQSVIYYASDAPETEIIAQLHTIAVGAKKAYSGGSGYPATRNAIWSFAYDNPFGGTKYLPMLTSLKVDSSDTRLVLNDFSKSSKSSDLLKALQRQETATWHSESALSPGAIHCLTLKRDYLKPAGQDFYAHGCDRHGKLIGGAEPGSVFLVALRNGESKFVPKMYRLPASKSRVERVCVVHLPGGVSLGFMHYLFPSLLIAASILCYIISQFMKPKADRGSFYTAGDLLSLIYVVVGLLWGHFLFFAQ